MEFKQSKTKENLMRGFAGESQAINRYLFSAAVAKSQKLKVIEEIFIFTANQERSHAKVFYNFLKEFAGQNISVDGNYPVDIHDDVVKLLRAAQHNEYQEYEFDYTNFATVAREEGFTKIYMAFDMIANVEKTHGDRFGKFADLLEQDKLFKKEIEAEWMCLKCGHIHKGMAAPGVCPICSHAQGYFTRLNMVPFEQ